MQVGRGKVVQFNYWLKDVAGALLESSEGAGPTTYLHGHSGMLPGLEQALDGRVTGDRVSVTLVEPYGPTHPNSIQRIPLKHLHAKKKPVPGAVAVVNGEQGQRQVTIVKVGKFSVDVDTNHPFAGMTLVFEVEITRVRDATPDELAHGHAHGAGGHHH